VTVNPDSATPTEASLALKGTSGLVRVRIPELSPLPPPPILPQPADPSQGLCKRSSRALESATNAMVKFYPVFSYKSNFEDQKFLVPGALVKVEYDQPVVPPTEGPAAPLESPGAATHYGTLMGHIMEVMMHESGQPILAFSAYQTKTQGSEAFGTVEKCQQLLQGAALGFGAEAAGAAPLPALTTPPSSRPALGSQHTADDMDYLARVIMKEAGAVRPDWRDKLNNPGFGLLGEQVAIGWAAINRAKRRNKPIAKVVGVISWPGGGARGRAFVEDINDLAGFWKREGRMRHRKRQWEFAEALLNGEFGNPIGPRRNFVHPRGMKACPGDSAMSTKKYGKKTICVETGIKGERRLPKWIVSKSAGGTAAHEPIRIGRAFFA